MSGDKLNNKSIFSEEATAECLANMERLSTIFTISDIMKFVTGEPQQAMYSLTIDPKEDARTVDRKYIDMILQKDKSDFDPHFIFGALGMGRKTKSPPINRHYDIVILNKGDYPGIVEKTKTTLGRLLANKIVWSQARLNYINENLVASQIKKIFLSLRDFVLDNKLPIEDFKKTLQVFEDFGFRMSAFISPSMDANILKTNKELEAKKAELFEKYKKELNDNNVEVAVAVEKELIEYAKKLYTNEDYLEWYKAGSSSKMSYNNDFKVSKLMIGTIPKGIGTGEFYVSTSNFMDGIKKNEIHIMADQSIVALHAKTNETAVSGYLAKMGESMCQTVYLDKYGSDCKTKKYVEQYITPDIINEIFGMYTIDGEEIDRHTIKKYIGKTIKMRNPNICEGSKICSKCAGNLIYKLENAVDNKRNIPIGLELKGILTELTQAALQKTHAMSVSLSDIGDMNQYLSEF